MIYVILILVLFFSVVLIPSDDKNTQSLDDCGGELYSSNDRNKRSLDDWDGDSHSDSGWDSGWDGYVD